MPFDTSKTIRLQEAEKAVRTARMVWLESRQTAAHAALKLAEADLQAEHLEREIKRLVAVTCTAQQAMDTAEGNLAAAEQELEKAQAEEPRPERTMGEVIADN